MEVALAIALAAVVGGVVFMLLDNWQRKHAAQSVAAPVAEPEPTAPMWTPYGQPAPAPAPPRSTWAPPSAEHAAWTPPTEERSRWVPASEAHTEPLPPRPLWTPPPSSGPPTSRWDDDDRHRGHDDEDDPPPGLWSGWARR